MLQHDRTAAQAAGVRAKPHMTTGATALPTFRRRPAPPLSDIVEHIWLHEYPPESYGKIRLLADGACSLIVNLKRNTTRVYDTRDLSHERTFSGTILSGPHSEPYIIDTHEQALTAGVRFRPGGAFQLLGIPLLELHNQQLSLDAIWGIAATDLREQLVVLLTPSAKFDALELMLLDLFIRGRARHHAVAYALKELRNARTIGEVTSRIGLSHRRFIEVFTSEVGLTPKLFCRIQRFQRVLSRVHGEQDVKWADIALACGYYDQAHLIREFEAFSGLNPSTYLTHRRSNCPDHVPIG